MIVPKAAMLRIADAAREEKRCQRLIESPLLRSRSDYKSRPQWQAIRQSWTLPQPATQQPSSLL